MSEDDHPKNHITWHQHKVSRQDRWRNYHNKGTVVWFTGLSGSGKSCISNEVDHLLQQQPNTVIGTYLLDGDNVRHGLCCDLGFSLEDRTENIRRVGHVAKLMADAGLVVLCAFISPYRRDRDGIRRLLEEDPDLQFVEVHVNASLATCERRDPKGLYQRARAGEIQNFTGIDDPFEEPLHPEIVLDSDSHSVSQLAQQVVDWLKENERFTL